MEKFKPMLLPNFKDAVTHKDKIETIKKSIEALGRKLEDYIILPKKDGCRVELIDGTVKGRSLKEVPNKWVLERYRELSETCQRKGIILEGELFSMDMGFNEISRRFRATDVAAKRKTLEKLSQETLDREYYGRSVDWLCTNHDDLKLYVFDVYTIGENVLTAEERLDAILHLFEHDEDFKKFSDIVVMPTPAGKVSTWETLDNLYEYYLHEGLEGIVMMHKGSTYKFGRTTLKEATLFKLKDDVNEYDGCIKDVIEGEEATEDAPKTTNALGRSVTSKLAEHRRPSGMAIGFLVEYNGFEHIVQLNGFDHSKRRELLQNKDSYIGKWIKYKAMEPTKNVPRGAFFLSFRDDK